MNKRNNLVFCIPAYFHYWSDKKSLEIAFDSPRYLKYKDDNLHLFRYLKNSEGHFYMLSKELPDEENKHFIKHYLGTLGELREKINPDSSSSDSQDEHEIDQTI